MSYKIDSINLKRKSSNEVKLFCEACQSVQTDIYICDLCYLFCCSTCSKNHVCPRETLETPCKFIKAEFESQKPLELCKKVSQGGNPRFGDILSARSEWNRSCLRCYITSATKLCLNCKLKYYCDHCFHSIHHQNKLSTHQFAHIAQNTKEKSNSITVVESSSTIQAVKPAQKGVSVQPYLIQFAIGKRQAFKALASSLKAIKNQLLSESSHHRTQTNESISCISKAFANLVEEAKLKQLQIILKIQESAKSTARRYEQIQRSIESQQRCLNNLIELYKQDCLLISNEVLKGKSQKCEMDISNLIHFNEISAIRENIGRKYFDISEEVQQICGKISQIELRSNSLNIGKMDSRKLSYASINTSRNQNSIQSQKSQLDIAYNKSSDKLSSLLTMSLITPKKSQAGKAQKHIENNLSKSLYVCQNVLNSPENETERSLQGSKALTFGSKKNLEIKKVQSDKQKRTIPASLLSPKASIKKFDRCPETLIKSKMVKTGKNIQKTKKMITEIRNEMIEFTNRYNCEKQASQISERQTHLMDISQLSIQSIVNKSNQL